MIEVVGVFLMLAGLACVGAVVRVWVENIRRTKRYERDWEPRPQWEKPEEDLGPKDA